MLTDLASEPRQSASARTDKPLAKSHGAIYIFAFLLLLLVRATAEREIAFVFASLVMMLHVVFTRSISSEALKFLTPIILIIAIGIMSAIPRGETVYNIARDAFYWLRLVPMAYCGFVIGRKASIGSLVKAIVAVGAALAAAYLVAYASTIGSGTYTRETLRLAVGRGYTEWFYAAGASFVALRYFSKQSGERWFSLGCLALILLASLFSESRTSIIVLAIMITSVMSWTANKFIATVMCPLVTILFAIISTPVHTALFGNFLAAHFHDIPRFAAELITLDQNNFVDINEYWRSFESAAAFRTYAQSNAFEFIFGQGFGTQFSLGIHFTRLGETNYSLPISHNAIPYVLLKTGLAGLCMFILFIYRMMMDAIRIGARGDRLTKMVSGLIVGTGAFWLISTPTTRAFIDEGASGITVCCALLAALAVRSTQERNSYLKSVSRPD